MLRETADFAEGVAATAERRTPRFTRPVSTTDPAHTRDAARTRQALLDAAGELFTSEGYDRTTVRAIADRAGVNQALLFRYFGNKEALFAQVLATQAMEVLHGGPPEELLERTLRSDPRPGRVRSRRAQRAVRLGAALGGQLRGGGRPARRAGRRVHGRVRGDRGRRTIRRGQRRDPDARLRAELLLGWLLGVNFLRNVLHSETIRDADPDVVVGHVVGPRPRCCAASRPRAIDS